MAVSTYTTDLTDIDDGSGTFTEPTGATVGTLSQADTDNFIQGTTSPTKTTNPGGPGLMGIGILDGAAHTITSPAAFYCWVFVGAGALINTLANGGIRLIIGNASTDYRFWYVEGSATFPYIGWQCIAIETDNGTVAADGSVGTPSATKQYFGAVFNGLITISKGNPIAIDALRWGRTITILNGDLANGYATFAGCATTNDAINARWGQFQAISGGYQLQGKLLLGTTGGTLVDFRDSNKSIAIAVSRKTATSFNAIEIQHASSRVDWDSCVFTALGTNSRGTVTVTDNADVNITSCSFTGMDTFSFLSATGVLNSTFRGCNAITAAGSNMTGTQVLVPTVAANTSALIWNVDTDTDGLLDNMTFSKGTNAHHAIEFGTALTLPKSITLRGIDFTGFSATAGGTTGDETFHIKDTTGTLTINLVGCTGNAGYRTDGATVVIVQNPVTFKVTAKDLETGALIENARVMVPVTTSDNFPYLESVSGITGSGTTATVTHTTHGLATGDNILIAGATRDEYNGAFTITLDGADPTNKYTYTTPATVSGSPAGGTITATMVLLNGYTNSSGIITDVRTYPTAPQPVSGWVRRHTYGPSYTSATWTESTSTLTKTGAFTGFSGTFLLTITAGTNMTPGIYLATYVSANAVTLPGGAGSADSSNVEFTIGAKPLYRQAPVADTVDNTNGLSVVVFLQPDE